MFILLIGFFGSAVLINKVYSSICSVRYLVYSFDHTISPEAQRDIMAQVALFESNGLYNPKAIIDVITRNFDCVEMVGISCIPYNTAQINITAYEPLVRVNDRYVVTDHKTIIPDSSYASYVLTSLPSLSFTTPVPRNCSETMMHAIRMSIKNQIFERYTLCWVSEHELYLQDMSDPTISLLCDSVSFPSYTKLVSYERLKNSIKTKGSAHKRWVADMRFDDQIVVSGDKRGRYGKDV